MPDPEIEQKVKQIIVDELGVDENEVTPNARFIDDLGADSLDTVELVMRFEEEFGIEIPDEDAEKIQSVRDAYNYIDQHKGKVIRLRSPGPRCSRAEVARTISRNSTLKGSPVASPAKLRISIRSTTLKRKKRAKWARSFITPSLPRKRRWMTAA